MPALQDVSESDESGTEDYTDSDNDDDDDDESEYDTDEEDEIRDMLREAMDTAVDADWFSSNDQPSPVDPFEQEDKKGNPFLKLLGSLRGTLMSTVFCHALTAAFQAVCSTATRNYPLGLVNPRLLRRNQLLLRLSVRSFCFRSASDLNTSRRSSASSREEY